MSQLKNLRKELNISQSKDRYFIHQRSTPSSRDHSSMKAFGKRTSRGEFQLFRQLMCPTARQGL